MNRLCLQAGEVFSTGMDEPGRHRGDPKAKCFSHVPDESTSSNHQRPLPPGLRSVLGWPGWGTP